MPDEDEPCGEYASPPCLLHELDPAYSGVAPSVLPMSAGEVKLWRKPERERLIAERLALDADTRLRHSEQIAAALDEAIGEPAGLTISAYWPFRGEPDLRPWLETAASRGGRTALPIVVAKRAPLAFRLWRQGDRLDRGVWNIPFPADGPEIIPDVVIAPLVGFDPAGYRLGYGGGFFDRTLASLPRRPRIFGVGYTQAAIPTIHPQPHDIPMDAIITEKGLMPRRCPEGRPAGA